MGKVVIRVTVTRRYILTYCRIMEHFGTILIDHTYCKSPPRLVCETGITPRMSAHHWTDFSVLMRNLPDSVPNTADSWGLPGRTSDRPTRSALPAMSVEPAGLARIV